jgi:hypothetical protein
MIAKGTAPALDYGIRPRDDGRFEIVWKTGNAAAAVSEADVASAEVTSATNRRYQVHFDKLLELATAGDWDAVRDYQVTGSNSYSKMVARYRLDLLAVHGEA